MGAMRARGVQPHRAGGGRRLPSSAPGLWLAGLSDVARTAGRSCFCKGGYATGWGALEGGVGYSSKRLTAATLTAFE